MSIILLNDLHDRGASLVFIITRSPVLKLRDWGVHFLQTDKTGKHSQTNRFQNIFIVAWTERHFLRNLISSSLKCPGLTLGVAVTIIKWFGVKGSRSHALSLIELMGRPFKIESTSHRNACFQCSFNRLDKWFPFSLHPWTFRRGGGGGYTHSIFWLLLKWFNCWSDLTA